MDSEVILPSDHEELEELRAEEDLAAYWADVLPTITRNLSMMRARNEIGIGCFSYSGRERVSGGRALRAR